MMIRTQIALDSEDHRRAKRRASELGVSLAEYVRRVVRSDLRDEKKAGADISAVFGIGSSGGSNVLKEKDRYIGEAVDADYLRKAGRTTTSD